MTSDMRLVIVPKSDQQNADDFLGGSRTVTITRVEIRPGTEQPVSVFFEGDNGKPYKPCKSMNRVMVTIWGADAKEYVGKSMTLYNDPSVKWGGMMVGGIRISHMSDLTEKREMALTATKGQRKIHVVHPLAKNAPRKTGSDYRREIDACMTTADIVQWQADNAQIMGSDNEAAIKIADYAKQRAMALASATDEAV